MAFLSNKTINRLNMHVAVVGLLEQSYTLFGPLYLYTHGFSISAVLAVITFSIFLRMPMRLLSFPVIRLFGLRTAIMIGAVGYGLTFPVLSQVKGYDGWLLLYLILYSIFNAMHWFAFHTFYSLAGEHEKRGRQVAMGFALSACLSALAPIVSALIVVHEGFQDYFLLSFPLIILMLLNLSRCENIVVQTTHWREGRKAVSTLGFKIHIAESASSYPMTICWLFVVYLYVGNITPLGSIITFGIIAQVLYQLLLGAWVDRGRGALIVNVAESLRVLTVLGRTFLPLSLPLILGLETVGAAGNVHHLATEPTVLYNSAKQAPHPIWFWFFAEMAWDTGTVVGAGGAALLLYLGVELRHVILVALPFIGISWRILHTYFVKHAYAGPAL